MADPSMPDSDPETKQGDGLSFSGVPFQEDHDKAAQSLFARTFSTIHLEKDNVALGRSTGVGASEFKASEAPSIQSNFKPDTMSVSVGTGVDKDAAEVFSLEYSSDGRFLACGCADGSVRIYNKLKTLSYTLPGNAAKLPATCVRFQPASANITTKNVLVVANADGTLAHWHMTSVKAWYTTEEKDNQIYTCSYDPTGTKFLTAGRDTVVRIYEDSTKTKILEMATGHTKKTSGHSNRIYASRWKPDDPNVVLTGGWDNTVQIWDIRTGLSVRSIYGPHICGNALDVDRKGRILTGSWRPNNAIEMWDFGTGKKIMDVEWSKGDTGAEMIYSAKYSPDGSMIAAGGSGSNVAKLFDSNTGKAIDRMSVGGNHKVYDVAWDPKGTRVAFGGSGDVVHFFAAGAKRE